MIAQHWDYRRLRALAPTLPRRHAALLVAVLAVAPRSTARKRWISIGPAVFQPSELAKLALAIWAASYLARRPAPRTLGELAKPFGLLGGLFAGLVILEPDLGTAIAIVADAVRDAARRGHAGSVLARRGGDRAALPAWSRSGSSRTAARASSRSSTRGTTRRASGYQIVQAMIGMGSGGIFGVGLGQGVEKIFYLPEAPTDMMLANIGEELGLVGVGRRARRLPPLRVRRASRSRSAAATRSASGSRRG